MDSSQKKNYGFFFAAKNISYGALQSAPLGFHTPLYPCLSLPPRLFAREIFKAVNGSVPGVKLLPKIN